MQKLQQALVDMVDASALQSALEKLNERERELYELQQKLAVSTKACEDDKIKSGKLKMLQEKLAASNQIIVDKDGELSACEDSRKKLLIELEMALNQLSETENQLTTLSAVSEEKVDLQKRFDQHVKDCDIDMKNAGKRVEEGELRIDRLKSTIDTLNEESISMKETITEKEYELRMTAKKLKSVCQVLKSEREGWNLRLEELEAANKTLQADSISARNSTVNKLQGEIKELQDKLKKATNLVERLREKRSALNEELRQERSRSKRQVENVTETFEVRVKSLEKKLQAKQRELDNMTNSESDTRIKLNDLKSGSAKKIHDLEQHLHTKQRELEEAINSENNACSKLHDVKSESTKKIHDLEHNLRNREETHSEEKESLLSQLSLAKKIQADLEEKVAQLVADRDQQHDDQNCVTRNFVAQDAVAQVNVADDVCEHEESLILSVGDNLSDIDDQQDFGDDFEISVKEEVEGQDTRYAAFYVVKNFTILQLFLFK